jgi:translation initiation factor IF-1
VIKCERGYFRVRLLNSGAIMLAHLSGKMRTRSVKVTLSDRVIVELSPYSRDRCRIVYRFSN